MKNCMIIAYHFYPDGSVGAKRFNLFSNCLSKRLNVLDILTIKEKYIPEKDKTSLFGGNIYRTSIFPTYMFYGNKIIKAINNRLVVNLMPIDFYSAWILPILYHGIKIIKKDHIDTIIVTGPPFSPFIAAYLLCKIFKIDLIIDYQDPWFWDMDRKESLFRRKSNWIFEKIILKNAKKVIFNTEKAKEEYLNLSLKFKIAQKSYVIANPFFYEDNTEPKYLEKDKKVILYAGNFYGKRRLKYIFEPLLKLYDLKDLKKKISIHLFGKLHEEDEATIKQMDIKEIIYEHERINYKLLTSYMKGADILYLSQGDDHGLSVPYKFTDYLTIKRPILVVTSLNSSTYNFMKNLDSGIAADIDDPESIYNALKELLLSERKFSYRDIEKYSINNLSEEFYNIICNY